MKLVSVWPAGGIWAYRAVFTQTNVGGGNVVVDISPGLGSEFLLLSLLTGLDDYAADRTLSFDHLDTGNNRVGRFTTLATVDNEYYLWPHSIPAASTTNYAVSYIAWFAGTDKLAITAEALAQNETLTITIRARLKGRIPGIVSTRSTGTVGAPTETYNAVL